MSASSSHAVGFWERPADGSMLRDGAEAPADTFYGWSTAAASAPARLYLERFGLTVVNLRIGSCSERPPDHQALASWLSPDDMARWSRPASPRT